MSLPIPPARDELSVLSSTRLPFAPATVVGCTSALVSSCPSVRLLPSANENVRSGLLANANCPLNSCSPSPRVKAHYCCIADLQLELPKLIHYRDRQVADRNAGTELDRGVIVVGLREIDLGRPEA